MDNPAELSPVVTYQANPLDHHVIDLPGSAFIHEAVVQGNPVIGLHYHGAHFGVIAAENLAGVVNSHPLGELLDFIGVGGLQQLGEQGHKLLALAATEASPGWSE